MSIDVADENELFVHWKVDTNIDPRANKTLMVTCTPMRLSTEGGRGGEELLADLEFDAAVGCGM